MNRVVPYLLCILMMFSQVVVTQTVLVYDHLRELHEITQLADNNAYPWISADGYRLYFSSDQDKGKYNLYMATRPYGFGHFGDIHPLDVNIPGILNMSCWLTNDELEIFFITKYDSVNEWNLMYSARDDVSEPFGFAQQVQFTQAIPELILGPSLTQDLSQLYLYNLRDYGNREMYILILNRINQLLYAITDTLDVPEGLNPDPGQLSKDGLEYYLGMEEDNSWSERFLYYYSRNSIDEHFTLPTKLEGNIQSQNSPNVYPSLTASKDTIVYVRSYSNHPWIPDYELHLAIRGDSTSFIHVQHEIESIELSSFPNPASASICILYVIPHKDEDYQLFICNASGVMVENIHIADRSGTLTISLDQYEPGIYFLGLFNAAGAGRFEKFVKL